MTPGHLERGHTTSVEIITGPRGQGTFNQSLRVLAAHGGYLPFGLTFFIVSEYMRHAIRLVVQMGAVQGWQPYVGDRGEVLGIERFDASALNGVLLREFRFTPDNVV